MDRDEVDMRTEQAWSMKDLLHGKKYSIFLVGTPPVIPSRQRQDSLIFFARGACKI